MKVRLQVFAKYVLDPRRVLLAAAIAAGLGLLASYVAVQQQLDRKLALRQGPPEPIAIQDFSRGMHVAHAGEVRLIGEVDMATVVTLPMRGTSPQKWFALVPVFPLSAVGSAILTENGAAAPDILAAQVARQTASDAVTPIALGLFVLPLDGPDAAPAAVEDLAEHVLGEGETGHVAVLNGAAYDASQLALTAHGAVAARGAVLPETFLAIEAWPGGREAALSQPLQMWVRDMFFAIALMFVAFAGGLQLAGLISGAIRSPKSPDADDKVQTTNHPKFAPLQPQSVEDGPKKSSFFGRLH